MSKLTYQSAVDFTMALRRALLEECLARLMRRPRTLVSFREVSKLLDLHESSYRGLQEIELDRIIGNDGQGHRFTRRFLPRSDGDQNRWRHVDELFYSTGFEPIEVYEVGGAYFVRDGNHRVSVNRLHGIKTIEAYVIEYKTAVLIEPHDDLARIQAKMDKISGSGQRCHKPKAAGPSSIKPKSRSLIEFLEAVL